jgi:hypothetical protein
MFFFYTISRCFYSRYFWFFFFWRGKSSGAWDARYTYWPTDLESVSADIQNNLRQPNRDRGHKAASRTIVPTARSSPDGENPSLLAGGARSPSSVRHGVARPRAHRRRRRRPFRAGDARRNERREAAPVATRVRGIDSILWLGSSLVPYSHTA